jgi:hypothetical protein
MEHELWAKCPPLYDQIYIENKGEIFMSKKIEYVVNGVQVGTIKEVCDLLGTKVTRKSVESGDVEGVKAIYVTEDGTPDGDLSPNNNGTTELPGGKVIELNNPLQPDNKGTVEQDDTETDTEEQPDTDTETDNTGDPAPTNDEDGKKPSMQELMAKMQSINEKHKATNPPTDKGKAKTLTFKPGEEVQFPEKGSFKTEKDLKKFYKGLTDEQLDEWISLEGLEFKECPDNKPIERMRKCMSILNFHFPKQSTPKAESKYAKYETEELLEMCVDKNLPVKDAKGDARILRMYCVMALRDAKVLE